MKEGGCKNSIVEGFFLITIEGSSSGPCKCKLSEAWGRRKDDCNVVKGKLPKAFRSWHAGEASTTSERTERATAGEKLGKTIGGD